MDSSDITGLLVTVNQGLDQGSHLGSSFLVIPVAVSGRCARQIVVVMDDDQSQLVVLIHELADS